MSIRRTAAGYDPVSTPATQSSQPERAMDHEGARSGQRNIAAVLIAFWVGTLFFSVSGMLSLGSFISWNVLYNNLARALWYSAAVIVLTIMWTWSRDSRWTAVHEANMHLQRTAMISGSVLIFQGVVLVILWAQYDPNQSAPRYPDYGATGDPELYWSNSSFLIFGLLADMLFSSEAIGCAVAILLALRRPVVKQIVVPPPATGADVGVDAVDVLLDQESKAPRFVFAQQIASIFLELALVVFAAVCVANVTGSDVGAHHDYMITAIVFAAVLFVFIAFFIGYMFYSYGYEHRQHAAATKPVAYILLTGRLADVVAQCNRRFLYMAACVFYASTFSKDVVNDYDERNIGWGCDGGRARPLTDSDGFQAYLTTRNFQLLFVVYTFPMAGMIGYYATMAAAHPFFHVRSKYHSAPWSVYFFVFISALVSLFALVELSGRNFLQPWAFGFMLMISIALPVLGGIVFLHLYLTGDNTKPPEGFHWASGYLASAATIRAAVLGLVFLSMLALINFIVKNDKDPDWDCSAVSGAWYGAMTVLTGGFGAGVLAFINLIPVNKTAQADKL